MKLITSATLKKNRPRTSMAADFKLSEHFRIIEQRGAEQTLVEFIGSQDFPAEFRTMQQYEVDAGRDSEPVLYNDIYNVVSNSELPEWIPIYRTGPAGVVLEEVFEGGEVKFMTIGESQDSVHVRQWGVGLEYSKKMLMYNYMWQMGIMERQLGVAHNALLNHLHLSPILTATYAAANQTAAVTGAGSLENNYLRTLEAAVSDGEDDEDNPRRGPYALIISTSNRFAMERALTTVPQEGFEKQGSVIGDIDTVVVYNGWKGKRGKLSTTYAGVTANKAYLVSLQFKDMDFQSFEKQPLQSTIGNPDVSRFILEQQVWDTHLAVFANPTRAVQEITLPTSAS